jgi:hypothetical protein
MNKKILPPIAAFIVLLFSTCKKENANFKVDTDAINRYAPLTVGKYIVYKLDSFVYRAFGTGSFIVSYQLKYTVDGTITDNLGRKGYRIIRQIRNLPADPWITDNTFKAIRTDSTYEFFEENLHFVNLTLPIAEGFSWKGNGYLPSDPYPNFDFASDFTEDWDYVYQDINKPLTLGSLGFDSTITILQRDESQGNPTEQGTVYADKTFAKEKYAKGVGLVYKEFLHWEYQGIGNNYKGFGITLTAIEHN